MQLLEAPILRGNPQGPTIPGLLLDSWFDLPPCRNSGVVHNVCTELPPMSARTVYKAQPSTDGQSTDDPLASMAVSVILAVLACSLSLVSSTPSKRWSPTVRT